MAKATPKSVPFSTFVNAYATKHEIEDRTVAGKRLRSKIRNAYGKNDSVTKWLDTAHKTNRDGNRYGDVSPAMAKELLAL